jgi:hypothetical protein
MRILGAALLVVLAHATSASAHTISLGYLNCGTGCVTFYGGSYHSILEGTANEGFIELNGVDGTVFSDTQPFSGGIIADKPAGLVDGTNNFYANPDPAGPMLATNLLGLTVDIWQAVTFTGLVAGEYQFNFNGLNTTVRFAPWNASLSSTFELTQGDVDPDPGGGGVPEPSTILLLASGMGMAIRRMRHNRP